MRLRFIVVDVINDLGEGDDEKVLAAIRMTKGVASADWTDDNNDGATWGAYHRCRRAYAKALSEALEIADARLRGPDGGIIWPPRPARYE